MVAWCRRRRDGGYAAIVRDMMARAKFPWRDGTMSFSGGVTSGAGNVGTVGGFDGILRASGVGIYQDIMIPGVGPVRGYHAQGAITNLNDAGSGDFGIAGGGTNVLTDVYRYTRSITGPSYIQKNVFATSGVYTLRTVVRRVNQDRVQLRVQGVYPNRGDACFNLSTGQVVSATNSGTATGAVAAIQVLGSGWYSISLTVTLADNITAIYSSTGTGSQIDDTSSNTNDSIDHKNWQCEAAPIPGLYLPTAGAAVSRTADLWTWDMSAFGGLSATAGEVFCAAVPYLWSAAGGAGHPSGGFTSLLNVGGLDALKFGFGAVRAIRQGSILKTVDLTSTQVDSGKSFQSSMEWSASNLTSRSAGGASSTAASLPWSSFASAMTVGSVGGNESFAGLVVPGYVPGGMTAAERAALSRLFPASLAISA